MISDDTIVAVSSAVGPAARMIVRLSGPAAWGIASRFAPDITNANAGSTLVTSARIDDLVFPVTLYLFRAPRSATGENVVEIHLPGNPLLARVVLDAAIAAGARAAGPGEFTSRAYFNGRLDLAAAEGVAAIISAQSERELNAARRLMSGELSRRLGPAMELLAETLALIEAGIDFAGEEITVLDEAQTKERIGRIDRALSTLLAESERFEKLSHEPLIVLVGRPNAGKSTLLNVLAGIDRAIVSPHAGTTRDVLTASMLLRRGRVTIADAAGLEEADSGDEVAAQMRAASIKAVQAAEVVVLVRDCGDVAAEIGLPVEPSLRVCSKIDLLGERWGDLGVSALTGEGVVELRDRLDVFAFGDASAGSTLALTVRHLKCVEDARAALLRADGAREAELIALELREALDQLGEILGSITPDDVLGRIFSKFCIGK